MCLPNLQGLFVRNFQHTPKHIKVNCISQGTVCEQPELSAKQIKYQTRLIHIRIMIVSS